jgi:hypothetical protein
VALMKLFRIEFDSQSDYVEASCMKQAIDVWHQHRRGLDPEWDAPETPEPESVCLVHESQVMRWRDLPTKRPWPELAE